MQQHEEDIRKTHVRSIVQLNEVKMSITCGEGEEENEES